MPEKEYPGDCRSLLRFDGVLPFTAGILEVPAKIGIVRHQLQRFAIVEDGVVEVSEPVIDVADVVIQLSAPYATFSCDALEVQRRFLVELGGLVRVESEGLVGLQKEPFRLTVQITYFRPGNFFTVRREQARGKNQYDR